MQRSGGWLLRTIYVQPNDHIEILLADAEDFLTNLPTSKHYSDKTLRALALQLRRVWEAHFRRLYPDFARYVAGVDSLDLADDDEANPNHQEDRREGSQTADEGLRPWTASELEKLAKRSAEIIRKMVDRGVEARPEEHAHRGRH